MSATVTVLEAHETTEGLLTCPVFYLTTAVYARRWFTMILTDDAQMIPGDECGLNFLTFVLQLRKNPGKNPQPGY